MKDFTQTTYKKLVQELFIQNYSFQTLQDFFKHPQDKTIILRHDVDRLPENALAIAKIEKEFGIKAGYYFRIVKESYDENIIKQIADLGHEIGYHYEDFSLCNGNYESAIKQFELNLERLRKVYPVTTICMHGSPLSKWDNRDLWKKYNYHDFDILAEPYFDIDFNDIFYLTDAGRSWNNVNVSIRDKVKSDFQYIVSSTNHIISLIKNESLANKLMINIHPHNWAENRTQWVKILLWQNAKNVIKRSIIHWRAFFTSEK